MTYTYKCGSCESIWDDMMQMVDRDVPLSKPCPTCECENSVKRIIASAPRISYDGALTVAQRAGSGWNDVLTKIKKSSGRNTTIETR